ncbi:MAG: hypothetical protein LBP92_02120, partial [Deltaproteobacteria bacterium]|nr:hypothetical protein [Deltaproteobacteria bacterium]
MSTESQTTASPRPADQAVAVIGLGALFPGGRPGVAGYWSLVRDGLDAISDVPADHFLAEDYYDPDPKAQDRIYCRRGAFIPKVPFQPLRYGVTPRDLESIDTTQLLGLVVADEALRDAGYPPGGPGHARTAVIMGVTGALKMVVGLGSRLVHPHLRRALAESGVGGDLAEEVIGRLLEKFPPWRESSFPGLLGNVTAGRVANRLDLGGPNMVVDAACASSLAAIGQALQTLRAGRADLVVSGGLDTFSDPFMFSCFSKTPALSPSGEVRPFDRAGDGTLLGEGLGVVVLKRLEDAERDGDRVYARILSVGGSSDGRGTAIFAPSPSGQRRAIEAAYDEAGWDPGQVDLVEAHGTGTAVGDGVELEALGGHFAGSRPDGGGPWCALGSVKSQIGHAKGAAGVAGLIKAVLALFHKVLPPTIKVRDPQGPLADPSFPLYLNDRARPWLSAPGRPRRAGVSAFGFGGSNFHCLLEESRAPKPPDEGGVHLVALSAGGPGELASALAPLAAADGDPALSLLARGLARSFRADAPARLALAGSLAEVSLLARTLPALLGGRPGDLPRGAFLGLAGETAPGGLVLSLPGPPAGFDPAPLGRALSALAISFPSVQECLDLAEGLRVSRGLSDHNLGLVLLPPRLAPAAFRARL